MMNVKLTAEQEEFLTGQCNFLDKKWFYMPLWYEKTDVEGVYKLHKFENLPEELQARIIRDRNIT